MIPFGAKASDRISGFSGILYARTLYQDGCVKVLLMPEGLDSNGKPKEGLWFDEQRVDPDSAATVGGPKDEPPTK